MELRLLATGLERQIFAARLNQARAKRDLGTSETARSQLGKAHLAFGSPYALFECNDELPERMIAGMLMHDLETLPQSYPRPDLTHLSPRWVVEMSEFWSVSKGGGLLARRGLLIVLKFTETKAALVYPMVKPWDRSEPLVASYFERVGEPIDYPYARALDGSPVWVQPMVLWEAGIRKLFDERVASTKFEVSDDLTRVRFDNPLPFQPSLDRLAFPLDETLTQPGIATPSGPGAASIEQAQR